MKQFSKKISSDDPTHQNYGHLMLASVLYLLLIIYGTLFPLAGWQWSLGGIDVLLNTSWPSKLTRSDVVVNLLIYIPLGYALCILISRVFFNDNKPTTAMIFATIIGACVCILLEYFQTFLPSRVTSYVDISLNTAGSMLGAATAVMTGRNTLFAQQLVQLKTSWFIDQPLTNLALLTLLLWAISQLTPLIPSPDMGNLRDGIKLVYYTILSPSTFKFSNALTYFLNISAIGLVLSIFLNHSQSLFKMVSIFVFFVLLLKIPMVDRQLSLEALAGAGFAVIFCTLLSSGNSRFQAFSSILLLLFSYSFSGLSTSNESDFVLHQMNLVPFAPQMGSIIGLVDIVLSIWPFMAIACMFLVIWPNGAFMVGMLGITIVLSLSFYIEWNQQYFDDRYPDITDVILAVTSFTVSYWRFNKFLYQRPNYDYQPVGKLIE